MIDLRPMTEDDLLFISQVRHHVSTLRWLHDQRVFTFDEMRHWFRTENPQWQIILRDDERVGYVRTSERDIRNLTIQIGVDVHPLYRRQGIATEAYTRLLHRLKQDGWERAWLRVKPQNTAAIELYRKLEFRDESGDAMSLDLRYQGEHAVKVISVYLGHRRAHPKDLESTYRMLDLMLQKEQTIHAGCDMDTVLIYNRIPSRSQEIERCEDLILGASGTATPTGSITVLTRENRGLSYGAFDYAYQMLGGLYDNWAFLEDDQIILRHDWCRQAITQLDGNVGFVALVGVSRDRGHPVHAHGGCGVTTRRILNQVRLSRPTHDLPHHDGEGYEDQEQLAEIPFTHSISELGYDLDEINMGRLVMSWGDRSQRTPKMRPWRTDGQ